MKFEFRFTFLVCLIQACPLLFASAEAPLLSCDAFDPEEKRWGMVEGQGNCSRGTAAVFHAPLHGPPRPPELRALSLSCCPMPAGSLSDAHTFSAGSCPDGAVVTGLRERPSYEGTVPRAMKFELRCTFINRESFHLLAARRGVKMEFGRPSWWEKVRSFGLSPSWTSRNLLPPEWRFGIGRTGETSWMESGCLSYPWGAALTSISSKECSDSVFRQIVPVRREESAESVSVRLPDL